MPVEYSFIGLCKLFAFLPVGLCCNYWLMFRLCCGATICSAFCMRESVDKTLIWTSLKVLLKKEFYLIKGVNNNE